MGAKVFVTIGAILSAFGILYFLVGERVDAFNRVSARIQSAKETLKKADDFVRQIQHIQGEFEKHPEIVKKLEEAFLQKQRVEDAVRSLESIAQSSGLILVNIKPSERIRGGSFDGTQGRQKDELSWFFIRAELVGTYESFRSFLSVVEKSIPLAPLTKIKIYEKSKDFPSLLVFELEFQFYALGK